MTLPQPRESEIQQGRITITLPMPPNRANARLHWRVEHTQKAAYYAAAHVRILQQTRARERGGASAGPVEVSATFYVWSRSDDDNITSRLKYALDSLKRSGVIRDDRRPWLRLAGIPVQKIDRKGQRLELDIRFLSTHEAMAGASQ